MDVAGVDATEAFEVCSFVTNLAVFDLVLNIYSSTTGRWAFG